jgi:3-dehydroquinate dehydratase-1
MALEDLPRAVRACRRNEIDGIELRLDAFRGADLKMLGRRLEALKPRPSILLTVRSKKEGGLLKLTDGERLRRFALFLPFARMIDCEIGSPALLSRLRGLAGARHKKLILSFHDLKKTPSAARLLQILKRSRRSRPFLTKIAVKVNQARDMRVLFDFLCRHRKEGLILIGMGTKGRFSRVFFPAVGSRMAFGHLGRRAAPGQIAARELSERVRKLIEILPRRCLRSSGHSRH